MKVHKKKVKVPFVILIIFLVLLISNLNVSNFDSGNSDQDFLEELDPKSSISYDWHKLWRLNPFDMGYSISIDLDDNIYMVGDGDYKIALVKFDSEGTEIWNRTWGGIDGEVGTDVAVDSFNDVIVAGYGWSFGAGDADIIVVKYTNDGLQEWNRTWGGANLDSGEGIDVDTTGNIYVTGYTESFDGSDSDMVLIKYDIDGNQIWNRTWGGSDDDGAYDVVTDGSDGIYIVGYTKSYAVMGVRDICVVKYDSSGSQIWNATYGVWDIDQGYGIEVDNSFNVYVAGSVTEDGTTYTDSCLVKFNSTGDYKWNKTWGLSFNDEAHGIYFDGIDIYVSGFINFQSPNYQDIFVIKCDTSGSEIWNKTWNSGHREYGSDIAVDQFGNIYVGGDRSDIGGYNWFLLVKFTLLPGSFTLSSNAGDPDSDGSFNLIWDGSEDADNYSVYQHDSFITEINSSLVLIAEGILTSPFSFNKLDNGTYYYKVVAFNEFGNSSSNCIEVNVSRVIPGDFILSSDADNPDVDGIYEISWTESALANNYSVYQHSSFITEINGSVTLVDEGLVLRDYSFNNINNGTYFYLIIAFNANGNRSSNCIRVDVELLSPQPFTLATDAGYPDSDGNFDLIWTESIYAINYTVYQHSSFITEINGSITLLQEGILNLFHSISGLNNGTYYFIVVAFNSNGNRGSNCLEITVDKDPPGPFMLNINATLPDSDGAFALSWNASLGADNYSLYWSYHPITNFNSSVNLINDGLKNLSYPLAGFPNGDFYFIVVAFNTKGNFSSNTVMAIVRLIPKSFVLSSNATNPDIDGIFILSWTISQYADNYSVYMSNSYIIEINSTLTLLADEITENNCNITILNDGTYYFIIVAHNQYGTMHSNNINVQVQIYHEPPQPPDDFFLILIILISLGSGIVVIAVMSYLLIKKRRAKGSTIEIP